MAFVPQGSPQVYPRLSYDDPERAVEWLERAFGWREREGARNSGSDGRMNLTEMELGSGLIIVGRAGNHGLQSPKGLAGGTQMVMAYVERVDEHCENARAAGARIVMEPGDQPWGDRRYEALDLEGHRWYFATHIGSRTAT